MEKTIDDDFADLMAVAGFLLVLAGFGTCGYQIFGFLRHGEWQGLSIISALRYAKIEWAYFPVEWKGMHQVLETIPLSLSLIVLGIGSTLVGNHIKTRNWGKQA